MAINTSSNIRNFGIDDGSPRTSAVELCDRTNGFCRAASKRCVAAASLTARRAVRTSTRRTSGHPSSLLARWQNRQSTITSVSV
ncbi:hypothetical protein VTN49DRAFT_1486 [Thermomyces lanuginosus]|uniref:uncharacterized protein n=1 Tax=Thermomyces lanuginosus TaxID=5541 RepID=UPI003744872A